MPESIEVELYRRLAERTVGRTIAAVEAPDAWFLKGGLTGPVLAAAVTGRTVGAVRRIGKLLLLDLEAGPTVGLRFGMTGTLVLDGVAGIDRLEYGSTRNDPAWDRVRFHLADGGTLAVRDARRLGGVLLDPDESALGVDVFALTPAALARALGASRMAVKARLLDQSRVAGVGNLIADEALWRAGIAPARPAGELTPNEVRRLHRHLRATVEDLLARGGSHTGDLFGSRLPGGRCPRDGEPLARSVVGGRTSWWCPRHQR